MPKYKAHSFLCITGTKPDADRDAAEGPRNSVTTTANVVIDIDGDKHVEASTGEGPWNAIAKAIQKATGTDLQLIGDEIPVHIMNGDEATTATDEDKTAATGRVELPLQVNDEEVTGVGESRNTTEAFFFAFVDGLNKALGEPDEESE